jgi:hypothetical protein
MFGFKKHVPDKDGLMERLRYLENFLEKLDQGSEIKRSIMEEIEKIRCILSGHK